MNVTFNVSENGGKRYADNSTSDYAMTVDKNSPVECDRIAISQQPLLYGFVGWNTDKSATTGDGKTNHFNGWMKAVKQVAKLQEHI